MVNIAFAITGITILNSVSIILLAVHARKKNAEIKTMKLKNEDEFWKSTRDHLWETAGRLEKKTEDMQKDLKDLYMDLSAVSRIPISKRYAVTRTFLTRHGLKSAEREELTEYVANIALKTIASELPEEERTLEMIDGVIIPQIRKKLNESSIEL